MTILEKLKILLSISDTSKDNLLNLLTEQAEQEFRNYCSRDDRPTTAEQIIIDLVIMRYNRVGTEGLTGQSYSGVREDYSNDYPTALKTALNRYRQIRFL